MSLLARKSCREKGGDEGLGELLPDDSCPETKDIHVVVLDALPGGIRVMANRGPDAREFVQGDADPHAASADHDGSIARPRSALGTGASKGPGHALGVVRVIVRRVILMGAKVHHIQAEFL